MSFLFNVFFEREIVLMIVNLSSMWRSARKALATLTVVALAVAMSSTASADFVAYNDLAALDAVGVFDWPADYDAPGLPDSSRITNYTADQGGHFLSSSGLLKDFATGLDTGVTLTYRGGSYNGSSNGGDPTKSGPAPPVGSDAYNIFNGIVNTIGNTSYVNTTPGDPGDPTFGGDELLTFTGLDPTKLYEVVLHNDRGNYQFSRGYLAIIEGVDSFSNTSSQFNDDNGNPVYSGAGDDSTRVSADNPLGYITRFSDINPGADGEFRLRATWDPANAPGSQYKAPYLAAVALAEGVSIPSVPEPASLALLVFGTCSMFLARRRCA